MAFEFSVIVTDLALDAVVGLEKSFSFFNALLSLFKYCDSFAGELFMAVADFV